MSLRPSRNANQNNKREGSQFADSLLLQTGGAHMRKGDVAVLHMKKTLCVGTVLDESVYSSVVLQYDSKKECIYLRMEAGNLTDLSLDAIYECRIRTEKEELSCTGRIRERYRGAFGKTFVFEIENGFYKINLK